MAVELKFLSTERADDLVTRSIQENRRIDDLALETRALDELQVEAILKRHGVTLYANVATVSSPTFLAYLDTLRRAGVFPEVRRVNPTELARLQKSHASDVIEVDVDLKMLTKARELVLDAAALGANDIHIRVFEKDANVQIRMDNDLQTAASFFLKKEQGEQLCRAFYTGLAAVQEGPYKALAVQSAQVNGDAVPGMGLEGVRIIRGPSYPADNGGGFLIARLQYTGLRRAIDPERVELAAGRLKLETPEVPPGELELESMGYTAAQLELVGRMMRRPHGIVLVVGPTGSGKTTTLDEYCKELHRLYPGDRLIAIETPTEYPNPYGINLSVIPEDVLPALKQTLRMDPDTIYTGEIRGDEEARMTFQAADTGHRVLASLHVTEPFGVFGRLVEMNPELIRLEALCNHERIIGIISQRLVSQLCPKCSVGETLEIARRKYPKRYPDYMINALRTWGDLNEVRTRGPGCPHCNGRGVKGRKAVAQVVVTDETLMTDVRQNGVLEAAKRYNARADADRPMIEHAIALVLSGTVDPFEAAHRVGEFPFRTIQ